MNLFSKAWRAFKTANPAEPSRCRQRSLEEAINNALSASGWKILASRSDDSLIVLMVSDKAPQAHLLSGGNRPGLLRALLGGEIKHLELRKLRPSGLGRRIDGAALLGWLKGNPDAAADMTYRLPAAPQTPPPRHGALSSYLELSREPGLGPFFALPAQPEIGEPSPGVDVPQEIHWSQAADGLRILAETGDGFRLFAHVAGTQLCLIPVPPRLAHALSQVSPTDREIAAVVRAGGRLDLLDPSLVGAADIRVLPFSETGSILHCLAADPERLLTIAGPTIVRTGQTYPEAGDCPILPPPPSTPQIARRRAAMLLGSRAPHLVPVLKVLEDRDPPPSTIPYEMEAARKAEPTIRRRSVIFLNHSYYNFMYLARELRARGWDAVSFSLDDPQSAQAQLYHGTDINLFDPDLAKMVSGTRHFLAEALNRFGIVHTYGKGAFSFFQHFWDADNNHQSIPWDLLDFKRRGGLVGYSHSGCLDMVSQSSFARWSGHMCQRCVWRERPDVCSDDGNLAWGWKVDALADLICIETDPRLDFKASLRSFRDPLTFALDGEIWTPDLRPPDDLLRGKKPGEVRVLHSVGNYRARSKDGINVKGTSAVVDAVERLQAEGVPIILDFAESLPSTEMRFLQVQADIIVDQLNYGRYGATAREGMMLGKPVVGRVLKTEPDGRPPSECIVETPIVHADETSIYDVLKRLAADEALRREIGRASREHALKWWSADVLAERFERVYDAIRDNGRPPLALD